METNSPLFTSLLGALAALTIAVVANTRNKAKELSDAEKEQDRRITALEIQEAVNDYRITLLEKEKRNEQ